MLTNLKKDTQEGYDFRIPIDILGGKLENLGQFDFVAGQDKYEGKILIIKGNKSGYVRDKDTELIKTFFPQVRIEGLEAGHWGKYITCASGSSVTHVNIKRARSKKGSLYGY